MKPQTESLDEVFNALAKLLMKHAKGLEVLDKLPGSKAKGDRPGLHILGAREVSILGRKPQKTYVAGIMRQSKSVGFYSMPLYSHPGDSPISVELESCRSGKSCLQITSTDAKVLKDLEAHLKKGIAAYRKEGWL